MLPLLAPSTDGVMDLIMTSEMSLGDIMITIIIMVITTNNTVSLLSMLHQNAISPLKTR